MDKPLEHGAYSVLKDPDAAVRVDAVDDLVVPLNSRIREELTE